MDPAERVVVQASEAAREILSEFRTFACLPKIGQISAISSFDGYQRKVGSLPHLLIVVSSNLAYRLIA